jgi:hypothetical protein
MRAPGPPRPPGSRHRAAPMAPKSEPGPRDGPASPVACSRFQGARQTVNELPQPHVPVAFGFLNVNPEPIMVVT